MKLTPRRRKYRPVHATDEEQIIFVHSVFIVLYHFTPSPNATFKEPYLRHFIRRRQGKSEQRDAKPMVYARLGDAERAANRLNEQFNTTNFRVRRVHHTVNPHYEPWRERRKIRDRNHLLRLRAKIQADPRHIMAKMQRRHQRKLAKEIAEAYERNPIAYEYYSIEDYEPVADFLKSKPKRTYFKRKEPSK